MDSRRLSSFPLSGARFEGWRLPTVLLAAGLAFLMFISFVGVGGAAVPDGQYAHGNGTDSQAPTLADGKRINDTAIEVTIADNHDVDENTIQAGDFLLGTGSIRTVSVSENGSDAHVLIRLERPIDDDELTVVPRADASVADVDGNALDPDAAGAFVIVRNMDGVAPAVREFTVTNATGGPATIRVEASERLADFNISVSGPGRDHLDASGFEPADDGIAYERTYTPPGDGRVHFTLVNITDEAGNTRPASFREQITADLTPPEPVAALDLANSGNLTIAFDARRSTDANGIANYTWAFGDGTTGSGPRVIHDYLPGNYTVTLTVADPFGNAATDSLTLNLTTGSGNVTDVDESTLRDRAGTGLDVSVQRSGANVTDEAVVSVENARRNETVPIGDGGPALVAHGPVSLDGLAVSLATDRSFDLAFSVGGNDSVADAARATDTRPVAGFRIINTVPDGDVEAATIRFSVDRDRLRALAASPPDVSLYRRHGGNWTRLNTTALNATDGTQPFRAQSTGFSRFAILAEPSRLAVTDATVDSTRVAPGDAVSVTATVANTGASDGTFTAGLVADGAVVGTDSVSVAAGDTAEVTLQYRPSQPGEQTLSVNGTAAGTVTVVEPDTGDFVVTNATLADATVGVNETFSVDVTVENRGTAPGNYTAGLVVDGGVRDTATRSIPPGESRDLELSATLDEPGEYGPIVNGTAAGTLTVEATNGSDSDDGGDGGLLAPLSGVLGALPLGLLRPLVVFVLLPVAVVLGVLKGLAIYLGY